MEVSVSQKGQVTIPISVRRALGIVGGSTVRFTLEECSARVDLVKGRSPSRVEEGVGLLKAKNKSVAVAQMDSARLLRRTRRI